MWREIVLAVLVVVVVAELLLYYLSKRLPGIKEKLSKFKVLLEPGAVLFDIGQGIGPRPIRGVPRYAILAASLLSLVLSAYFFYSIVLGYVAELLTSVIRGAETPQSPLIPVIPGITLSIDILLPLLISIGIGLAIHEFSHLAVAVINGVPVESWGIGLFLIFPIAYVRVNEDLFSREGLRVKASVLGAGVLANLAVALISLMFAGLVLQSLAAFVEGPHIIIVGVNPDMPAGKAGLPQLSILRSINGTTIDSLDKLWEKLNTSLEKTTVFVLRVSPLDRVGFCGYFKASQNVEDYVVTRTIEDVEKYGYRIGIVVALARYVFSSGTPGYLLYADCQLQVLYIVNFSLAIVNSAPLIVTDGGKLLTEVLRKLRAGGIDKVVQWTTVALIAVTVSIGLMQSITR